MRTVLWRKPRTSSFLPGVAGLARLAGLAGLCAGLAGLAAPATSGAAAAVNPLLANARVQGQFQLAGLVTVAKDVVGEHKGQKVLRTWTFTPACPTGACATLKLTRGRGRGNGTDKLVLQRTVAGSYQGSGSFYAPLRCGGRIDPQGEQVPFSVTVTVTAAGQGQFGVLATRLKATYTNPLRINRSRCVAFLGHDAATYHGHLVPPRPPTGGAAPLSDRSPAGS
jgi:hypothetical protein